MDNHSSFCNWFSALEKKEQKEVKNIVKNSLVESGKFQVWRNCQFAQYSKYLSETYGTEMFKKYELFLGVEDTLNEFEKKMCKQIYDSNRKRTYRLKKKIAYYIKNYNCLWLTLTFTDSVLLNTSHNTRRVYICRFLKSFDPLFACANIDYGDLDKNPESHEREHYHAIITLDHIDMSLYSYGFIFVKRIIKDSKPVKLAEYVDKLTSHSFKDSTKGRDRIIYIRRKKIKRTDLL